MQPSHLFPNSRLSGVTSSPALSGENSSLPAWGAASGGVSAVTACGPDNPGDRQRVEATAAAVDVAAAAESGCSWCSWSRPALDSSSSSLK